MDFSINSLQCVQLVRADSGLELVKHSITEFERPRSELFSHPEELRKLVKSAIRSGFSGNRAVVSMPPGKVRLSSIQYRLEKDQHHDAAIIKAMESRMNTGLKNAVVDYIPIGNRDKQGNHVALVAAADRQEVIEFLELLRQCGLRIESLEIGPVALARLINHTYCQHDHDNVLVLNFAKSHSYLSCLAGGKLLFDQETKVGEDKVLDALADYMGGGREMISDMLEQGGLDLLARAGLNITEEEDKREFDELVEKVFSDLLPSINRALIYSASETRGEPVRCVYILGALARWPGVEQTLFKTLKIPMVRPDPLADMGLCEKDPNNGVHFALATGLALRGL
ncbi:MAG TPA: hypothetical protein DCZ03_15840 [Gammaproteobacteria bacterium]|nr:hypothetical protein [Gammaproteobacteria bacterium]